jgi:hypothetical protein
MTLALAFAGVLLILGCGPLATMRLNYPIEPMTLGNLRANGVRSLDVSC